jgi:hypothetical protein
MGEKGNIAESLPAGAAAGAASGATSGSLPSGPKGRIGESAAPGAAPKEASGEAPKVSRSIGAVDGADARGMPSASVGGADAQASTAGADMAPMAALGGAAAGGAGMVAARRRRDDDEEAAGEGEETPADPDASVGRAQPDDDASRHP